MLRKNKKTILIAIAAVSLAYSLSAPVCLAAVDNAGNTAGTLLSDPQVAAVIDLSAPALLPGLGEAAALLTGQAMKAIGTVDLAALGRTLSVEPAGLSHTDTAALATARPAPANSLSGDSVFGTVAIPFKHLAALDKFAGPLAEMKSGKALECDARGCDNAETALKAAEAKTAGASLRDKIDLVNFTVNHAIRYQSDMETYHVTDYWAKPSETLSRQQGDCEDFAILKMAALHAEGVSLDDMALVILFDQQRHFYHAVLSVSVEGNHLILDNMRDQVLSDKRISEYLPLYSIVDGRGFLHGSRDPHAQAVAAATPLTKIAPGEGEVY